jgi:hypothetical protein
VYNNEVLQSVQRSLMQFITINIAYSLQTNVTHWLAQNYDGFRTANVRNVTILVIVDVHTHTIPRITCTYVVRDLSKYCAYMCTIVNMATVQKF